MQLFWKGNGAPAFAPFAPGRQARGVANRLDGPIADMFVALSYSDSTCLNIFSQRLPAG